MKRLCMGARPQVYGKNQDQRTAKALCKRRGSDSLAVIRQNSKRESDTLRDIMQFMDIIGSFIASIVTPWEWFRFRFRT